MFTIISYFVCSLLIFIMAWMGLGSSLFPLILSFVFAYFSFPIILKLENKGISRVKSASIVFILLILLNLVLAAFIIPVIYRDIVFFMKELPMNVSKLFIEIKIIALSFGIELDISEKLIREKIRGLSFGALKEVGQVVSFSFHSISDSIIKIISIFMIPIFYFYVICDYESISSFIYELIPLDHRERVNKYFKKSNIIFSSYIRGQATVACILAVLYGAAFHLIGMKFGLVIGICTGFLSLIPYVGFTVGVIMASIMSFAYFHSILTIVITMVLIVGIQLLESFVLTPKIVGDKVGLGPFSTMLALIIGGNLVGIVGMFFAIPIAGIIKMLMIDFTFAVKETSYYKG